MDGSSLRSVTFCDINGRSQELRRKVPAPDVELSSHVLLQGMDIWRMINASQEEHQKQADR
jgi:hypothetical protein